MPRAAFCSNRDASSSSERHRSERHQGDDLNEDTVRGGSTPLGLNRDNTTLLLEILQLQRGFSERLGRVEALLQQGGAAAPRTTSWCKVVAAAKDQHSNAAPALLPAAHFHPADLDSRHAALNMTAVVAGNGEAPGDEEAGGAHEEGATFVPPPGLPAPARPGAAPPAAAASAAVPVIDESPRSDGASSHGARAGSAAWFEASARRGDTVLPKLKSVARLSRMCSSAGFLKQAAGEEVESSGSAPPRRTTAKVGHGPSCNLQVQRQSTCEDIERVFTHDKQVENMIASLDLERQRERKHAEEAQKGGWLRSLVVSQHSKKRQAWDVWIFLLIMFTVVTVPLQIAYAEQMGREDLWFGVNFVIDFLLLLDIVFNFFTSFRQDGREVFDPAAIARNYARGWLGIDLLASCPLSLITFSSDDDSGNLSGVAALNRTLRIIRLSKFLRIFRILKSTRLFEEASDANPSLVRLIKLFLMLFLYWHWCACLYWFFEVTMQEREAADEGTWRRTFDGGCYAHWSAALPPAGALLSSGSRPESEMMATLRFLSDWGDLAEAEVLRWSRLTLGGAYAAGGVDALLDALGAGAPPAECAGDVAATAQAASRLARAVAARLTLSEKYLWTMYWVVSVSSGFNEPSAADTEHSAVFILWMVISGTFINAFVIGSAASIIAEFDRQAAHRKTRMGAVKALLQQYKVGRLLRRRILHYFDYLWSTHGGSLMDEGAMLQDLPLSLRVQLTMAMHKKIFTDVPLFRHTDARIVCLMVQSMRPMIAMPDEIILEHNAPAKGIFVIVRGCCTVLVPKLSAWPSETDETAISGTEGQARVAVEFVAVRTLVDGDFFGEVSLLADQPSSATVSSRTFCNCMVLVAASFYDFLERFPRLRAEMERCKAEQRSRYNNKRGPPREPSQRNSARLSRALSGPGAGVAIARRLRLSARSVPGRDRQVAPCGGCSSHSAAAQQQAHFVRTAAAIR